MSAQSSVAVCLWYPDNAEEAARLYTSLVPNSAITSVRPSWSRLRWTAFRFRR
jgi:predicted 3-demethylubiquinone-9 3-methyltransferase (glyoxalase superfamily)